MPTVTEKIIVEIDGVEYRARLATIERTSLGYEGHGIMTAWLHLGGESWGQGAGGYGLSGEALSVWVKATLKVVGAEQWEDLPNKRVFALYDMDSGGYGFIKGLKSADSDRVMLFDQVFDEPSGV